MYGLKPNELKGMRKRNEDNLKFNKERTAQRKKRMEEKNISQSENFRKNLYEDCFVDGNIIKYRDGFVMEFSETGFYYRGQIKDYKGACYSSLFRKVNKCSTNDEKIRKRFLNQLRINEFKYLINNFTQVSKWPFGTVYPFAIAQHYGFDTDIIDFTNDLDVALFFACCKHTGNNRYSPLTEEDIKPKLNKYGLLFRRDILLNSACLFRDYDSAILPIGYQPFTRCNRQRGHYIKTKFGENIQTNRDFTIFRFKHSIELSRELYNKFNGGKKLFNYDALDEISDLLEKIKTANTFSNESFQDTYMELGGNITKDKWIMNLKENENVVIGKASYELSEERIEAINKKWSVEKFIEEERVAPGFRIQYYG